MGDPGDAGFEEEEAFDLDAVVWLPGVDYLSGWHEAQTAADELAGALGSAGVDTSGVRARADTGCDGAGVVRLVLPVATVREIARLARGSAGRLRKAS
ncbi:hypothetical protein GCM10010400_13980 [Streptomyces aculeolatus]|uniref:hypothetical protein n=1 Tax=Streptomyces aculeolatus TaxID=270689 RepID=UPI001CECD6F4|nr:hypothetical protein [Streptomyces aculeolatus]